MKLDLIDKAFDFLTVNPEVYNPGFPMKVRNKVLCASAKNSVDNLLSFDKVDSKRLLYITSVTQGVLDSFYQHEYGTTTDFLGAIILMGFKQSPKNYQRCFYSAKSKVNYSLVAQYMLGTNENLTSFFLNADKYFKTSTDKFGIVTQDLSVETMAETLYQITKEG